MSNTVQILEKYWTEHPAWFGGSHGEYLHLGGNQQMLRLLLRTIEVDERIRVVDLSCALGGNARWLASLFGCQVDGVDEFKPAVLAARELAKAQGVNDLCRFTVAKPDQLPYSDGTFQLGVSAEGDVHWSEVHRVMAPQGIVIGSTVVVGSKDEFFAETAASGFALDDHMDVTEYARAFYRSKEAEARLLVEGGLMSEQDLLTLVMHTIDLYDAGSASHVLFRLRRE